MGTPVDQHDPDVTAIFAVFDASANAVSEALILDRLNALVSERYGRGDSIPPELFAERLAFAFAENCGTGHTVDWGTYFGPHLAATTKTGEIIADPDLNEVTPEIVARWRSRSAAVGHPVLKIRYADLVWDLGKKVTAERVSIEYAHTVIDSTIEAVRRELLPSLPRALVKLRRALKIALAIKDRSRLTAVCDTMIDLEDRSAVDQHLGTWGFCFDDLVEEKKVALPDAQVKHVLQSLEARLGRAASDANPTDPQVAEATAMRLLRHYRRVESNTDVQRVLRAYVAVTITAANAMPALAALPALQEADAILREHGLTADADALSPKIDATARRSVEAMQTTQIRVPLDREKLTAAIRELLSGTTDEIFAKIAIQFLPPSPAALERELREDAVMAPLDSMIGITLQDAEGRPLAKIGSVEADLEGRVIHQMTKHLDFDRPWLHMALADLFEQRHIGVDDLVKYIFQSPCFSPSRSAMITAGLTAYLSNEHVVTAHVLVPQIEAALREIARGLGGGLYKQGRHGGLQLRNLDELLRLDTVVETLDERVVRYLQVLFTDPRGWNLRNSVCHGLMTAQNFGPAITDRILHAMLVLAQLRAEPASG